MSPTKFLWFLTNISSICTSYKTLEKIFDVFFNDDMAICFMEVGQKIDNYEIILKNRVTEVWKSDQITNNTCLNIQNYVIFANISDKFDDLLQLIPALSKILLVSQHNHLEFKKLHSDVLLNNWDLIIYLQDVQDNFTPFQLDVNPKFSLCSLLPTLICTRNESEISHFLLQRSYWSLKEMLRVQNRALTVATIQNPPYTIVTNDTHVTGAEAEILKIIFPYPLNFKVLSKTSLYKIPVSQNPWKNISRELDKQDDGADIAISSLWMRQYTHDITFPLEQQCIAFMVKRPVLYSETSFVFQALSFELWSLNILFLIVIVVILTTLQSGLLPEDLCGVYDKGRTILDVVRTFAGSSMQRNLHGRYQLLRFVFLLWLLFCLIMVTCYNAGLTTSLKYPKLTEDVKDFRDMISLNIPWMDETDGVSRFMASSNDTISKAVVELYQSEHNKTYRNWKLAEFDYGFRIDKLPGGYIRNLEGIDVSILDQFQIVQGCYANVHMVFGLKLDSPLKKYANDRILRSLQLGFVNRWYRAFAMMKKTEAMSLLFEPNSEERQLTLDLQKMKGAFFLLLIGMILGMIVFAFETLNTRN